MAGGVNDVNDVVIPLTGCGSGGDGDSALLFLLHPVHGGCAIVNFTDLVVDTGVKKNALSRGGFARVDMRHDPDVANHGEVDSG
ncbi:unannotated protein [freshwater metagenome]|uniref:Unannotated protein n=1 Tax=freshwater metagenome TaxID=449393 RepID=A0A6J6XBW2_9ZZZZ